MTTPLVPRDGSIAIRLRQTFPASRERVFRAWTDPEALRRWWCPPGFVTEGIQIDLRLGGSYRFGMRNTAGGPTVFVCGQFLEVAVPERLVYTWAWENAFPGLPITWVRVEFRENVGSTEVTLIHEGFPEVTNCLAHHAGWRAAWTRIEFVLKEA